MHKLVMAQRVMKAMEEAGIIRREDQIRRVVIDLTVGEVARIYVDRLADERILDIIPQLADVEVIRDDH